MYLIPLNNTVKIVKMITFVFCVFYHNKEKIGGKTTPAGLLDSGKDLVPDIEEASDSASRIAHHNLGSIRPMES